MSYNCTKRRSYIVSVSILRPMFFAIGLVELIIDKSRLKLRVKIYFYEYVGKKYSGLNVIFYCINLIPSSLPIGNKRSILTARG